VDYDADISMPLSALTRPPRAAGLPDESLEEINRLWTIARAFANTAHDVNNALQVIAGNAELLAAKEVDHEVHRRIASIAVEAARASSLLATLQAYVRRDRDLSPTVDLSALVSQAVSLRAAALRRERIAVDFDPTSLRPIHVQGPGHRLLQIVIDLLLEGERVLSRRKTAKITVRVEASPTTAIVRVTASPGDVDEATGSDGKAAGALTDDALLWAAGHLAEQAGGSVAVADANRELVFTVPLASPSAA
jgi:signal transduction histidine kinase